MKLYTMPGTCALAPNIAVAWEDAPIEIVNLPYGDHKSDAYLAVNPRGQVPALVFDDGSVLTEGAAILAFIGAKFGGDAFARDTPLGYREAEALSYLSSEVHAAFKGHFSPGTFAETPQSEKIVRHKTYARLDSHFKRLNDWVAESDGPWLLPERSYADAYLYIVMRWIERTPLKLEDYPKLAEHQREMEKDESVQLALERQGMKPTKA
ncbi:glutathione S-transferase N-terminal domain-containing protein [uncultured Algimonas sp.]|uniref:glutathione S-transferase N-terminal domain-containing protein n=1 Tax=uncultured Algimonas sp. TaxID=1547920 RepID=UPI002634C276|nr:glutathione S-transferase N-terminal domain-containing protein [uncultured Algimonas sp.]